MYKLKIISSTVRPGRKGPIVAGWIESIAKENPNFDVELIDLGELNLPMMNEPNHPAMQKYEHEHTKAWSKKIDEADAFIFVTAEYNGNFPAPLHNAIEYLVKEWAYKAAGIVSYGGASAGMRAANNLKGYIPMFKLVPIPEMVNFPFFSKNINDEDILEVNEISLKAADNLLKEILKWTEVLKTLRS